MARRVLLGVSMMAAGRDDYREAARALVGADTTRPIDELSDALLLMSGLVSRLRRCAPAGGVESADLFALDEASGRAIQLTRELRERLAARGCRSEYASLSSIAREVVGHLQAALADDVYLTVECPPGPAIVSADRSELRALAVAMLSAALDAREEEAALTLEVCEHESNVVELRVRWRAAAGEREPEIGDDLRAAAHGVGAIIGACALEGGETAIGARFPSAC